MVRGSPNACRVVPSSLERRDQVGDELNHDAKEGAGRLGAARMHAGWLRLERRDQVGDELDHDAKEGASRLGAEVLTEGRLHQHRHACGSGRGVG